MSTFTSSTYNLSEDYEVREDKILMHVDLDMFFAAVEILLDPELKGKPLIVGNPDAKQTGKGVVLTASYEARRYGVHSGMPMNQALRLCPHATISNSGRKHYNEVSRRVMDVLKQLKVPMLQTSVDEAYLDITSIVSSYKDAFFLAKEIQKKILDDIGISSSIGVGPTLKIAKIASDYKKPKGITVVTPEGLEQFFTGLPVTKIPGVGKVSGISLKEQGFSTCDKMFLMERKELILAVGNNLGNFLYDVLHGLTSNQIIPRGQQKSISHESTFHGRPGDIERYHEVFEKLFSRSYSALREKNLLTKTVITKIRFNGFETITRAKSIGFATDAMDLLKEVALELLVPYFSDTRGLRLIGVGFSHLEKREFVQTTLDEYFK